MGIINVLDDNTINKIAAGEVVEKPASVVKELVENSIDAGATDITVEIRGGGISFIRITDNGRGIAGDEIETAFLRHATSKIKDEKDLNMISTLGFRGEALASVACISKIEMLTKTANTDFGNKIYIEGGRVIEKSDIGCPNGTTITVRELFYNTPARLKFLKSESREGAYVTEVMENMALSHADISFKYRNNDKLTFATSGKGDLRTDILSIYGKKIYDNLIPVKGNIDFISVEGYIGSSTIARGSRINQSTFINSRYIKNKTITAAVEAAFKSMVTANKFPFFVLEVLVNPEFVDVNVHPSKLEIKFQDDQMVFKAVYKAVKDALISKCSIESISEDIEKPFKVNLPEINFSQEQFQIKPRESIEYAGSGLNTPQHSYTEYISESIVHNKMDVDKNPIPMETAQVFEKDTTKSSEKLENEVSKTLDYIPNVPKFGPLSVVGQLHFVYIIAEGPDEMFLIDQHAAHERIYYEKYLKHFKNSSIQSQNLLIPVIVELSPEEKDIVEESVDILMKLGFEVEDFGMNSVSIRAIPVLHGNVDTKDLFINVINDLKTNVNEIPDLVNKIIYTMACKSAVKAGDKLNFREMSELVNTLRFCDNPYICPHGRPTIIKMSYYDLEKKFKRVQ